MKSAPRLLLLVAAVLLSACEVRTWVDIDLTDPEAGVVEFSIGFDEQLRDFVAESGEGGQIFSDIEGEAVADGWTVTPFVDGDVEGITVTRTFSSFEELHDALTEAPPLGGGEEGPALQGVSITDTGETIRFEGSIPGAEGQEVDGVAIEEVFGLLEFDARVSVTFPGEVIEHNGELVDRTVTWRLFEDDLSGVDMFAESRRGGGIPGILFGALALALVVAGVVAYRLLSDRRSSAQVVDQAPEVTAMLEPSGGAEPGLEHSSE